MSDQHEARLIREVAIRYVGARRRCPDAIREPASVAAYLRRRIHDDAREYFVAIYLDGRHRPIADCVVSIGTATASLVHPREVFQPAIAIGTCALLIGHNHPSGATTPSREDLDVTKRLAEAGRILGITVLDHVVWARGGAFHSIRESYTRTSRASGQSPTPVPVGIRGGAELRRALPYPAPWCLAPDTGAPMVPARSAHSRRASARTLC